MSYNADDDAFSANGSTHDSIAKDSSLGEAPPGDDFRDGKNYYISNENDDKVPKLYEQ